MYRNVVYKTDEEGNGIITLFTWDEQGNRITLETPLESKLYYEDKRGQYKSLFGTNLTLKTFRNTYERNQFIKKFPTLRPFGSWSPERQFLLETFKDDFESPDFTKFDLRKCFLDIEIEVADEFPEPEFAKYPINCITVYDSLTNEYHTFILDTRNHNFDSITNAVLHIHSKEENMLVDFLNWYSKNCPDILSGWNVEAFDIPYLVNRVKKLLPGQEENFSPVKNVKKHVRNQRAHHEPIETYAFSGVSILDYMFLYKYKFGKPTAQSFSLQAIAMDELKKGKTEYEGSIADFQKNDFVKFVAYNINDVELVKEIDDKLKFINLTRTICNMGLCQYDNIFSSSPYIVGALVLEANKSNLILPSQAPLNTMKEEGFTGAFVFEPQVGVFRGGVATEDVGSLYPNLIISCNISPETKIGKIIEDIADGPVKIKDKSGKEKVLDRETFNKLKSNLIRTANNVLYCKHSQRKGLLGTWLDKTYKARVQTRKQAKQLDKEIAELQKSNNDKNKIQELIKERDIKTSIEQSFKLMMNSIYGQLGSKYFPLFDIDNAEAITISGQHVIKNSADFLNNLLKIKFNSTIDCLIGGDTDSLLFNLLPITSKVLGSIPQVWTDSDINKVCNVLDKVTEILNENCKRIVKNDFNSDVQTIEFKRELFCTEGIFLAKKRYILHIRDSEGARVDKFKYSGVEVKKNEFTSHIKNILGNIIEKSIVDKWSKQYYWDTMLKLWDDFKSFKPEQIALLKQIKTDKLNSIGFMQVAKGTPGHAKATIYHNQLIDKLGLKRKYEEIKRGDKIKIIYIKDNEYGIDVIGFKNKFPKEFAKIFQIDYEKMFENIILSPLETYTEINNWSTINVRQTSLVDIQDL